jgi:Cu2+-exporting ATPase
VSGSACDHCLLPVPPHGALRAVIAGAERVFCCAGCRGVFELVHAEGLGSYYQARRWDGPGQPVSTLPVPDLAAIREGVRHGEGADEVDVYVDGIHCASCVWLNERMLHRTPGVALARVNYATHRARIRFDPAVAPLEVVLGRIRAAGYVPRPWSGGGRAEARRIEVKDLLVRLGTAAFLASQLMIYQAALYAGYFQGIDAATRRLLEWISLGLTLPVLLYAGAPFLSATWAGLRHLTLGMDALVVFGSWSALGYSLWQMARGGEVYFDTAVMIPTLVLVGRYVEAAAKGRATEAVARLAALAPREARRVGRGADGREEVSAVPVALLAPGDLVRIVPGERVPVDGVVRAGASEVDESLLTGESRPVAKAPGAEVMGGTANQLGALDVEVTRVGERTVLAGIVRAVEEAQVHKPRVQAIADRVVGAFVPAMLVLAAGTAAAWLAHGAPVDRAVMTGIAVVVIACPCALGLATPIAVIVSTGVATTRGILVRSGDVLERAGRATDALLDKTGTVTLGRPELREVVPLVAGADRDALLALAGAVEARSEHHLGRAIAAAARATGRAGPAPSGFRAVPGRGVEATVGGLPVRVGNRALLAECGVSVNENAEQHARQLEAGGHTVVFLAVGEDLAALLPVADVLREEAAPTVAALRAAGLSVSIVSGDHPVSTAAVAGALGVEAVSQMTPVEKREVVARLQRGGRRVLFVGDGLNDAPALSRADVGVAMGRGTDVTLESADAVLVRDDLGLLPDLIRLSRRTTAVIRQNVFWAFAYNVTAVPLAMAGQLHPIVAAGAMAASSVLVVLNSARLRGALGPARG